MSNSRDRVGQCSLSPSLSLSLSLSLPPHGDKDNNNNETAAWRFVIPGDSIGDGPHISVVGRTGRGRPSLRPRGCSRQKICTFAQTHLPTLASGRLAPLLGLRRRPLLCKLLMWRGKVGFDVSPVSVGVGLLSPLFPLPGVPGGVAGPSYKGTVTH